MPIFPVAPTLFSITIVFLSALPRGSATSRAVRSDAPPAEYGTMILTCGQGGASAKALMLPTQTAAKAVQILIMVSLMDRGQQGSMHKHLFMWQVDRAPILPSLVRHATIRYVYILNIGRHRIILTYGARHGLSQANQVRNVSAPGGHHIAAWRHPKSQADAGWNFSRYVELAQTAERGLFDMLFLADTSGVPTDDMENARHLAYVAWIEPFTTMAALASVTKHIGLVCTSSTSFETPFGIARKFASLDLVSRGRAG